MYATLSQKDPANADTVRTPLIIGGIWQSAWLFVFTTAGTAKNPSTDETIGNGTYVQPDHVST